MNPFKEEVFLPTKFIRISDWEDEGATEDNPVTYELRPYGATDLEALHTLLQDCLLGNVYVEIVEG